MTALAGGAVGLNEDPYPGPLPAEGGDSGASRVRSWRMWMGDMLRSEGNDGDDIGEGLSGGS